MLFRAAELLRERKFELMAWLVYEVGKSWAEAEAETAEAIDFMEFYARQALRYAEPQPLTPSQYIWERRLEACSRDLLEPRLAGRPVADIAYGRGFNDAAHFSRAFRERFG